MSNTKVSIILPTYNGSKYIKQAIDSCLCQTYSNIELIIVDDGSTDETPELLRTYKDDRIKIIAHVKNEKLPKSLNTGFSASSGEFLTWTSDDNLLKKNAVETLVDYLVKHPEVDFVYTDHMIIDDSGSELGWYRIPLLGMIAKTNLSFACFMYRREVYKTIGNYNETAFLVEDYEYWLRVYQKFRLGYLFLESPLYYYRDHNSSLTSQYRWNVHLLAVRLRKQYFKLNWFEYSSQTAYVHVQAAFEAYRFGNYSEVMRRFGKVIIYNPVWLFNRGFASISLRSFSKLLTRI
jgi:glycosyltransferase involved in cell wall biosynthesis